MTEVREPGSGKRPHSMLGYLAQAESMVQLAIALPIGCAIGWLAGSWADHKLHQHWIAIVGLLLGAVGGFLQIYRVAADYLKDDRNKNDNTNDDSQ